MTHYRTLLLSLLTVFWISMLGVMLSSSSAYAAGTKKSKHHAPPKAAKQHLSTTAPAPDVAEKPLDLSIPYTNPGELDAQPKAPDLVGNIFAPETKKKQRSLELEGDFLMSPEPEAEKRKSVDGAGFIIRIKP